MSYLRTLDTDSLPSLGAESASARRIRSLEEELASYRRGGTPRAGILKYSEPHESGGQTRRAVAEVCECDKHVICWRYLKERIAGTSGPSLSHMSVPVYR